MPRTLCSSPPMPCKTSTWFKHTTTPSTSSTGVLGRSLARVRACLPAPMLGDHRPRPKCIHGPARCRVTLVKGAPASSASDVALILTRRHSGMVWRYGGHGRGDRHGGCHVDPEKNPREMASYSHISLFNSVYGARGCGAKLTAVEKSGCSTERHVRSGQGGPPALHMLCSPHTRHVGVKGACGAPHAVGLGKGSPRGTYGSQCRGAVAHGVPTIASGQGLYRGSSSQRGSGHGCLEKEAHGMASAGISSRSVL